jgi:plasmid stability protein
MAPFMTPAEAPELDEPPTDADGATARIAFRVPDQLKARIEEAAAAHGRSVNAWLTRAATAALRTPSQTTAADPQPAGGRSKQHYTGWVS